MRAVIVIGLTFCFTACVNPFAPAEGDGSALDNLLGDPKTINGFYQRFQSAYTFRDTAIYGPLVHPEFIFSFRDFEQNIDISWGRPVEMLTTFRLFFESSEIQLQWNNTVSQFVNATGTEAQVTRRFNLTVVLPQSDVLRTDGSANFVLQRSDSTLPWRLLRWRDQSNI